MRRLALLLACMSLIALRGQDNDADFQKAMDLFHSQGPRAALPEFERLRAACEKAHNATCEARNLNAIAICYKNLGDPKNAMKFYQSSLTLKERLGDPVEIAKTLNNMGEIYRGWADYPHATAQYRRALTLSHQAAANGLKQATSVESAADNNLGLILMSQGDYTHAREYLERALELGNNDGLENLGNILQLLGRNREALDYFERYLNLKRDTVDESIALGNLALSHLGLGEIPEATRLYDQAIALAQKTGERSAEADWRKGKGSALQHAGQFDAALAEYRQALAVYEKADAKQKRVELMADLGYLHLSLGDFVEAEKDFNSALTLARSIKDRRGEINSLIALGDLQWRRTRYPEALHSYQAALAQARQAGDRMNTAAALVDSATVNRDLRRFGDASAQANEALSIAREVGARLVEAQALYTLAEASRLQRRPQAALPQYSAGESIARESEDTELTWRLAFGAGQAYQAMDRKQEAIAACRRAAATIETVRARLREDRFQAGYIEDKYQVYVLLVQLLLDSNQLAEAFSYAERLHARGFADMAGLRHPQAHSAEELELRERIRQLQQNLENENARPRNQRRADAVESYSRELTEAERAYEDLLDDLRASDPRFAAASSLAVPKLSEVQKRLPAGAALLEFLVADDRVLAFVVTATEVRPRQLPLQRSDLVAKVGLLRELINRPPGDEWRAPAASLAAELIAPLEQNAGLAGINRLYIVPHQVLHYLPFGVLPHGQRLLADDYTIAYLPAAATLMDAPVAPGRAGRGQSLLAMAPARSGLRHAVEEVQAVHDAYPRENLTFTGVGATEAAFKKEAPSRAILHLATHASFNQLRPMLSALQLEPGGGDDGSLEVREILDMRLNADLVTLSACSTAMASGYFADLPAGDDLLGFSRAFLYAGGRAVLASLWDVDDLSTSLLMRSFYGAMGRVDKAAALAAAQRDLRKSNPKYQHPYYWAPFIFIGKMN